MDGEGLLPGTDRWNDALLRQVHSAHPTLLQRLEFATLTHPSAGPPCRALLADDEVPSTADIDRARHALEVNVLGPWRTCEAFLPLLRRSGAGRIVNVSSGSGAFAETDDASVPAYSVSKAGLHMLTLKLALELGGTGSLVNAACPGWVRTRLGGSSAPRSPKQGADTTIWLATLPNDGPTGGFFRDRQPIPW